MYTVSTLLLRVALIVPVVLAVTPLVAAEQPQTAAQTAVLSSKQSSMPGLAQSSWSSQDAVHAYGLPDIKANKKGRLALEADRLSFTSASGATSIRRDAITAVSVGNERVEIGGTGVRILRMAIPDGGGMAAAAMMHHRVDMLTVESVDAHGGMHSALFYLPANEAERALKVFADTPYAAAAQQDAKACGANPVEAGSVLLDAPDYGTVEVPAAYRGLVYEHLLERLRTAKGVSHVYRYGEVKAGTACPQYTIHFRAQEFKQGNQVVRAATGPIGMFTAATKIRFEVRFTDHAGLLDERQEIKTTVRTESESTSVADKLAKTVMKHYLAAVRANEAKTVARAKL